jgi:hypothetical protein
MSLSPLLSRSLGPVFSSSFLLSLVRSTAIERPQMWLRSYPHLNKVHCSVVLGKVPNFWHVPELRHKSLFISLSLSLSVFHSRLDARSIDSSLSGWGAVVETWGKDRGYRAPSVGSIFGCVYRLMYCTVLYVFLKESCNESSKRRENERQGSLWCLLNKHTLICPFFLCYVKHCSWESESCLPLSIVLLTFDLVMPEKTDLFSFACLLLTVTVSVSYPKCLATKP